MPSILLRVPWLLIGFLVAELYRLSPNAIKRLMSGTLANVLLLLRFRNKVIEQNLNFAFGANTAEKKRVKRDFYRHFGSLVFEILQHLGRFRAYALKYSQLNGLENYWSALSKGKGVILLSSHVGNWELMSACGGLAKMDLMIVTKKIKPAWLHEVIERSRLTVGVKGAYEPTTLKMILRQLRARQTVGFVLDQYAGPPIGVRVPYFGVPVGTSSAVAVLARRTGAPVLPVITFRSKTGVLMTTIGPEYEWVKSPDQHEELAINTAKYVNGIEKEIRRHPDQWLWTHRRFKGDLSPLRPNEWREPRNRA